MPEQNLAPSPDHYLVSANGRLGEPPQSKVSEVDRILDLAIRRAPENGLVIHFHGGLTSRDDALRNIAASLTDRYAQAKAYPLFFVWESGFREAILNNKQDLLQDPAFRELVKKVSEWVLKKLSITGGISFKGAGGQAITDEDEFRQEYDRWFADARDIPPVEDSDIADDAGAKTRGAGEPDIELLADEIERQLDNDPEFKDVMQKTFNAASSTGVEPESRSDDLLLNADALDEMFPPEEDFLEADGKVKTRGLLTWGAVAYFVAGLVIKVIKRFRSGRDHGVYCSIVEEVLRSAYGDLIGATAWNTMKNDTLDSFAAGLDTCGLLVINKLKALEEANKRFKKITLVGHSAGALYVCNFLDAAKAVGLSTPIYVVFLAPAVTCERFAAALDANESTYLKNFRMFAMRNSREIEDQMLKPLYTRSLLYFVSGLLEGNVTNGRWEGTLDMPLLGMERFFINGAFSQDEKVQQVWKFLTAQPQRVVWSKAEGAGAGLNSDSRRHGDFDNDESTLKSLLQIISE